MEERYHKGKKKRIVKRAMSIDILHRVLKSSACLGSLLHVLQYFKIKAVFTRNIQGSYPYLFKTT